MEHLCGLIGIGKDLLGGLAGQTGACETHNNIKFFCGIIEQKSAHDPILDQFAVHGRHFELFSEQCLDDPKPFNREVIG